VPYTVKMVVFYLLIIHHVSFFFPRAQQLSWDIPADAGFLYAKDAMLRETIKEPFCSNAIMASHRGYAVLRRALSFTS
jgi:hypothetical protein